ncbi:hypothetical protein KIPB_000408 [Kipferlia bialata]|uniref:Calcineurin-like phosphoesterase domain-containing protein n=1 Tax=Kipferlia bialata TaxID=797122 RepID=A0A9K3GEC3_9EUKA|nr:hypothetical protein KIPB_000408 [Kipferlia bialata]|eukprot:g408.t1
MRILSFADLHGVKTAAQCLTTVYERETRGGPVDLVVIGGDTSGSRLRFPTPELSNAYFERTALRELQQLSERVPIMVLSGNTDFRVNFEYWAATYNTETLRFVSCGFWDFPEHGVCIGGYGFSNPCNHILKDYERVSLACDTEVPPGVRAWVAKGVSLHPPEAEPLTGGSWALGSPAPKRPVVCGVRSLDRDSWDTSDRHLICHHHVPYHSDRFTLGTACHTVSSEEAVEGLVREAGPKGLSVLFSHCPPSDTNAAQTKLHGGAGCPGIRLALERNAGSVGLLVSGHIHEAVTQTGTCLDSVVGTGDGETREVAIASVGHDPHYVDIGDGTTKGWECVVEDLEGIPSTDMDGRPHPSATQTLSYLVIDTDAMDTAHAQASKGEGTLADAVSQGQGVVRHVVRIPADPLVLEVRAEWLAGKFSQR